MIHFITWLPLPYQLTLCRSLHRAYGDHFVVWFAERAHKDFPYRSSSPAEFNSHYLSEEGYRKLWAALWSDPEAVVILCGWRSPMTNRTLLMTSMMRIPIFIWADHPHPRQRNWLAESARRAYLRFLGHRVNGFLACGTPTVTQLVSLGIKPAKIINFPYWVDLPNEWSIPERCLHEAANKRPLRLVTIGRQIAVKQFEVAIKAVALANKRAGYPLAELVLAGDGPERPNLEAVARHLGYESSNMFSGWLEPGEVSQEIRRSDALIVSSGFEPYGVVVLEAMAAGRPVLASEGVMGALDRDEGTGAIFLHPSGDVERLADQIVLLANDRELLTRSALAARETAEKWPPNRAAAIVAAIVNQTISGETRLRRTQSAESEFVMPLQKINHAEKISIAASRK